MTLTWTSLFAILGDILTVIEAGGVCLAIVAYFQRKHIRRWLVRYLKPLNRFPVVGGEARDGLATDAIVFTVGQAAVPSWVLANYNPRWAAFIASEGSLHVAQQLCEEARASGIQCIEPQHIEDPDNPDLSRLACNYLIDVLRSRDVSQVVVDVTGGKVPMSLGAFMAAEERGVDSLYVSSIFDTTLEKPDMTTAKLIRVSRPIEGQV